MPVFLALSMTASAGAQTRDSIGVVAAKPAALCFRGARIDRCQTFLILEIGAATQAVSGGGGLFARDIDANAPPPGSPFTFRQRRELRGVLLVNAGLMANRAGGDALGAMVQLGSDFDDDFRIGIVGRQRRWMSSGFAVDLDAGPIWLSPSATTSGPTAVGLTAGAGLNYRDLLALTAHIDAVDGRDVQFAVLGGARSGSYLTLLVAAAVGALAAAFAHSVD